MVVEVDDSMKNLVKSNKCHCKFRDNFIVYIYIHYCLFYIGVCPVAK